MKHTLEIHEMAELLRRDEYANWSYEGSKAMATYLDDFMPEDAEFDRVAVRCEWSEHPSLTAWADQYFGSGCWADDIGIDPEASSDEVEAKIKDYIMDRGQLIEFGSGIIVSDF